MRYCKHDIVAVTRVAMVALVSAAIMPAWALAQTPEGADRALTATVLGQYLTTLAADSLRGATPSPELDRTVDYLIGELRALGVKPGLPDQDHVGWIQYYPLPGQLRVDYTTAGLALASMPYAGTTAVVDEEGTTPWHFREKLTFAAGARFLSPIMPRPLTRLESPYKSTVLVAGPHTVASARAADVAARIVFYVPMANADSAAQQAVLQALIERSAGVVVVSPTDSARFAAQIRAGMERPAAFADEYMPQAEDRSWLAEVRAETVRATLALNGIDWTAVQAARTPLVQPLPFLRVRLMRRLPRGQSDSAVTAPNVVATLPGREAAMQGQWIVVVASMDRVGPNAEPDRMDIAGLLALARALAAPGAQPRRPVVFVATSGSGIEFAGRQAFATWARGRQASLTAVTLDLAGQPSRDSVAVDGLLELTFRPATSPLTITMLHPELGLTVVDTGSVFASAVDRIFSDYWIPTLGIRNAGSPVPSDSVVKAGARLLHLVLYAIDALANANVTDLPVWNDVAKGKLVTRRAP